MFQELETYNDHKLELIEKEWHNMVTGREIDISVISPSILASWKNCRKMNLDPYKPLEQLLPSSETIDRITECEDLFDKYGQIIEVIREIAREAGMIFRIADRDAKTRQIIACPKVLRENFNRGNYFAMDASESNVGTNALWLAIKENRPVQVIGPEHYNYNFHNINCSAAPIHDEKNEVIGVINISTNSLSKSSIQTLGMVIAIARVLDNHRYINKMVEELTVQNAILNEIMDCLPSGVVYINENKRVQGFNKRIIDLLKIEPQQDETALKKQLLPYMLELGCLDTKQEKTNEEILLKLNNKTESFLVSNREIELPGKEELGNIVMLENTDNVLKLHSSLRDSNAIYTFNSILGHTQKLLEAKDLAKQVSKFSSAVIIYGESGTGKELFAQAIHNCSLRVNKPFVAINCGAIPYELFESELFGYEAGAFTGALKGGKPGKLEIASGGTLFLDEIESMPLNLQIKLLRALSVNRIVRVGGAKELPIDIRIISAAKKDLLKEVEAGNFREDFYYRISVVAIDLPPLRERKQDIPVLVENFIRSFAPRNGLQINDIQVDNEFYQVLMAYDWRGNIRELRNVIERAVLLMGGGDRLTIEYLPENLIKNYFSCKLSHNLKEMSETSPYEERGLLKVAEEVAVEMALLENKGNLTKTAKALGIARSTLYQKIKESKRLNGVHLSYK